MIMKIQVMIYLWLWNAQSILCLHEFKFSEKRYAMFIWLCQARYVCYAMIHGIFTFMHLMLFTKRIAYVFKNKISGSQSEEP